MQTLFVEVEERPRSGAGPECAYGHTYVRLGRVWSSGSLKPAPSGFFRLLEVDGVNWECLKQLSSEVPTEALALDILLSQVPPLNPF